MLVTRCELRMMIQVLIFWRNQREKEVALFNCLLGGSVFRDERAPHMWHGNRIYE